MPLCGSGAPPPPLSVPGELPAGSSGEFAGWGTSLAWFAHATGTDPELMEAIAGVLFSKDGLGLNIVRYNIGGANLEGEDIGKFRAGGAVPCCYGHDGCYTPDPDRPQTAFLLRARELIGPEAFVSEAFANSPPWYMTKSGTSRGGTRPYRNNLAKAQVDAYASSLLAALKHFRDAHGLKFDTLSPFNEPGSPAWIVGMSSQEGCYFSHARMDDVIRALHARREELAGTGVVAHEQFCISDAARDARKTPKDLWPAITRVNTHTYDSSEFLGSKAPIFVTKAQDNSHKRRSLKAAATASGKDVWVSEFGTGKGGEPLARHILRDLATLLPTAWVYWQAVEEPGSTWGLVQATFPAESKAEIEKVRPTDGDNLELLNDADAAASDARAAAAAEVAAAAPRAPVKIIFTPQYHVVKLLARAVPRGARVFAVPELKQRGAGAWLGGGRVTYALVNPSKARGPRALTLDARPLLVAAGGKAAAARVTTLDAAALDRAAAEAGGDVGASSREVVKDLTIGEGGSVDVAVAPGHVAVIEITAV